MLRVFFVARANVLGAVAEKNNMLFYCPEF